MDEEFGGLIELLPAVADACRQIMPDDAADEDLRFAGAIGIAAGKRNNRKHRQPLPEFILAGLTDFSQDVNRA